jgi:hypothetical protein
MILVRKISVAPYIKSMINYRVILRANVATNMKSSS